MAGMKGTAMPGQIVSTNKAGHSRRKFVKRGALFVPMLFIPRLIRAQSVLSASGLASFIPPAATGGGGGGTFPSSPDGDWRLNGDLTDSSGNGNSLTVTGTTTYTTDEHSAASKAFSFDGSTFATLSTSSVGNYTSLAFSILVWVKPTGSISNSPVIINHGAFNSTGYYLQFFSDGHVEFQIGRGSTPFSAAVKTAASLVSAGNWYGVLVIINGSAGQIWVNGTNQTSSSDTLSAPSSDSNNFRIGAYSTGSNKLTGAVAQVAIWSRVLNSTEISNIYSLGSL
jgi:hypothetical protein